MKKRPFKKIIFAAFLVIILSLILAGILPQELSQRYFYQALWFKILWFILSIGIIVSIVNYLKSREYGFVIVCIGLLLILSGGFVTDIFGKEGFFEIKKGETVNRYWIDNEESEPLGFSVSLKDFSVELYPEDRIGMKFVKSYRSAVDISKDGTMIKKGVIEVNRPLGFGGFDIYQYGYDIELPSQTVLQAVKDPGLPFVYSGYIFLLFGMVISFRKIWKI